MRGTGASTRGGTHIKLFKEDPSAWLHPFSGSSRNVACRTWLLSPGILSSWSQTRNQLSDKVGQQQLTITLSSCLWTEWHCLASCFPPRHGQVPLLSCARTRQSCRRGNYCILITCWANIWRCSWHHWRTADSSFNFTSWIKTPEICTANFTTCCWRELGVHSLNQAMLKICIFYTYILCVYVCMHSLYEMSGTWV